jgi:hypothetical protein
MKKFTIALAMLMALSVGVAHAQDAAPAAGGAAAPAGAAGSGVQYKQKTVYDFDDDTVEGDLVRPDGEFVDSRRGAKHSSLIKIRENFIPEMLKSVEAI